MPNEMTDFAKPSAWRAEVDRSRRMAEPHWSEWEENLRYYLGQSPEATSATDANQDWVNINADFVNCEVKLSQLFFDQPDLQLSAKGEFKTKPPAAPIPGAPPPQQLESGPILAAHRALLNELLGPSHADVLPTIHKAIKDCLVTAGVGVTKIGYTATMEDVEAPAQLGSVLGLNQSVGRPVDEKWYWERVPSKKFRIPADFTDTDFDKAPWVAMEFRMPLLQAQRLFKLPDDYTGTTERDSAVLTDAPSRQESTSVPYVDGVEIWYRAALFDADVVNPEVIRRHVLVEGSDEFVEKSNESPFQTLLPTGRLSADSVRGYPLHVLVIRTVPDAAYVPSDSTMARPLVRELCKFRSQQVQERDANIPRILYDSEKLPPEVINKIEQGQLGSMIPVPSDTLAMGPERIMAQVAQGNQTRGSYVANDYIQRDLDKTLGLDAVGAGVKDTSQSSTATEITVVDRQRSVRIDAERRRVLAWYLKGVEKFSALVCRYMTPQLAVPYIGQQAAMAWAQWDKKTWDGRFVMKSRPDSQIKLDAATERKFAMDLYQFAARDPHVNRVALLQNLIEKAGLDPSEVLVPVLPPQPEKPNISFALKGEDLVAPQAQQVREIMAQGGIQISQEAINATATQMFQQLSLGIRDANGKAVAATPKNAEHGGVTDKIRPLSQRSADTSGQREGMARGSNDGM